jgi:hypothetical protein
MIGQPILVTWATGSALVAVDDAHWAAGAELDAVRSNLPTLLEGGGVLLVSVSYEGISGSAPAIRFAWYATTSSGFSGAMPPYDGGDMPEYVELKPGDTLTAHLYFDLQPGLADVHLWDGNNFMAVWPAVAQP